MDLHDPEFCAGYDCHAVLGGVETLEKLPLHYLRQNAEQLQEAADKLNALVAVLERRAA